MLNKDDITEVCGVITTHEILEEISRTQLDQCLRNGYTYPFRNKYVLVEDEEPKENIKPRKQPKPKKIKKEPKLQQEKKKITPTPIPYLVDIFNDIKICEGARGIYYANKNGEFFVKYKKSGSVRYLTKYENRAHKTVDITIAQKTYVAKNLIAKMFIKGYRDGDIVLQNNNDPFDCRVENLKVIPKSEYAKDTYALIGAQPVGLFEDGKLVKQWKSARKAAKDLFCSYQTVMDTCNGKWKTKLFDVRWI